MEDVKGLAQYQDQSAQPDSARAAAEDAARARRQDPGGEPWLNDHGVNLRFTLPLPFGRYYVTLLMGKERRSDQRLAGERRKHPLLTLGNVILMAACGVIVGLAILEVMGLLANLYLEHRTTMEIIR